MQSQAEASEQSAEKLERAEQALHWLSATAIELVGFPLERDIDEFICAKTRELVGNAIVAVNSIDAEKSVLRIRKLAGVGPVKLEKVEQLLGQGLLSTNFEGVDDEAKQALLSGSLTEVHGGLYRIFFERVPKPVCLAIEKLLGLEGFYSIGLRRRGRLLGNVTIATRKGARLDKEVLEAFLHQVSAALEHRLAEKELRESEAKLKTVTDNVTDVVWMGEIEGLGELSPEDLAAEGHVLVDQMMDRWQYTFVSPSSERILGYRPEEVLRLKPRDILTERSYAEVKTTLAEEVARGLADPLYTHGEEPFEVEHVRKDGQIRWCAITARFLRDSRRKIVGILGVTRDVTERKRAEDALRKEQHLLRQLLELHERERQLISYEIHDGLAQHVFGAQMMLQGLEPWSERLPDDARRSLEQALRLLDSGGKEARTLISQIRPPILDESGIITAIHYLIEEQSKSADASIEFRHHGPFEDLAPTLQVIVFRIAQEGLANACRHSGSRKVLVALARSNGVIRVEVRDWGCGFEPGKVENNRFGLQGIRERARLFGGKAAIDTTPGKGTRVTVELPDMEH